MWDIAKAVSFCTVGILNGGHTGKSSGDMEIKIIIRVITANPFLAKPFLALWCTT